MFLLKLENSLAVVRRIAVVLRVKARSTNSSNAKIAVVLIKARISAAKRIPGICGERR